MGKHLTNNIASQSVSGAFTASNLFTEVITPVSGTVNISGTLSVSGNIIALNRIYEMLLVSDPFISSSMSTTYSGSVVMQEKWTDSGGNEIKRSDFAYSGSLLATETVTVYSATNGTTVVAQAVTTYAYISGNLSSASKVRTV